jgi:hypothetical protein
MPPLRGSFVGPRVPSVNTLGYLNFAAPRLELCRESEEPRGPLRNPEEPQGTRGTPRNSKNPEELEEPRGTRGTPRNPRNSKEPEEPRGTQGTRGTPRNPRNSEELRGTPRNPRNSEERRGTPRNPRNSEEGSNSDPEADPESRFLVIEEIEEVCGDGDSGARDRHDVSQRQIGFVGRIDGAVVPLQQCETEDV